MKVQPNGVQFVEASKVLEAKGYKFSRQNGYYFYYISKSGNVIAIKKDNLLRAPTSKVFLQELWGNKR
jgi:predicted RNA binding protein YcfA (HicA-like mRNA interferase family)